MSELKSRRNQNETGEIWGAGNIYLNSQKGDQSGSAESNLRCENELEGELLVLAVAEGDDVGVKCTWKWYLRTHSLT